MSYMRFSLAIRDNAERLYASKLNLITQGEIYLSELMPLKAGNCFYQAKCYERAVKEYEKAGAFTKCLSACSAGKLFEIGFEFLGRRGVSVAAELEFLQKGAHYYFSNEDMKGMMKFVRSFPSKGEIQKFLAEKCCFDELVLVEKEWGNFEKAAKATHDGAVYYFHKNNFKRMMKFVRSFRFKGEMRRFLHEKGCLDELILLEKEWGNFEKAANVARLKPDPVLEADLLHQGGLHKESSLKILWHVFLNSTFFHSTDEPFKQKERLLRKAVSIAKNDSDVFYQFVCNEAKILSEGKSEEELLKKGAEFIFCYKENAVAMGLERVKTAYEIENIENDVLRLVHSSFKSLDLLPEFLLLLETRGKFVQAVKISSENDHSTEAALRRLWYVFFGSLWAHGRRAWPLASFKQKDELLNDLNSYVTYNSDSRGSALMHIEISILSDAEISLSQMWRHLREAPRGRSLRMHYLISRRILDVHLLSDHSSIETMLEDGTLKDLEGVFSENIVSAEGLIYFWSYWKELVWELIDWSNTRHQGVKSSNIYEDFLFNYFGVRKYDGDKNDSYVVLNAEAQWVKEMRFSSITKNGYLYIIGAHEFTSMATRYWCSEILLVSEKVLKKLHSLHAYSTVNNFPMHQQTKILTRLFKVTKSLQNCKLPYNRFRASSLADQYFKLCVDPLFCNVFHINWKNAQSKEMIFLREKETFLNMLKEAISINRKSYCNGLTYGQMGRMAMIFLGSKRTGFNDDTKKKVRSCTSRNWRDLFDKLNGYRSSSRYGDLAISLLNVLKETFSSGWRRVNDCVSPACFLYLMERLVILSFYLCDYAFTTRSSCVEWLTFEEWDVCSNRGCDKRLETMKNIHHSIASMISEMLNSQDKLMEWLRRSKEMESSYPILVLRLTVLLSLVCANSGRHYYNLLEVLRRTHLVSLLPSTFRETLIKGIKEDRLVDAVAISCKEIDDPLVMVSFTEDFPRSAYENAIFLDMSKPEIGQKMVMEVLYPEEREDASTSSNDHGVPESDFPLLSN